MEVPRLCHATLGVAWAGGAGRHTGLSRGMALPEGMTLLNNLMRGVTIGTQRVFLRVGALRP